VSSGKKIRLRAILKENTANYISWEKLINVNFAYENCKNDCENDQNDQIRRLIGYQNTADFFEIWAKHFLNVVKP